MGLIRAPGRPSEEAKALAESIRETIVVRGASSRLEARSDAADVSSRSSSLRFAPDRLPSAPARPISGLSPVLAGRGPLPAGNRELRTILEASAKTFMTDATAPKTGLMQSVWARPILLLVITTLVWGAHSIVGRLAVGQIGPMTLVTLRWAVALIPIFITARPSLRQDWPALRARWVYLALMGASGFTAFNALFYVAAHHTSALNLSIIQGAVPALVLLGARVFLGVRFTALQALGALVTMIGVGVIAAQGDLAKLAALAFNSGDVMMVVGVVLYAGYTIGLRQRPHVSQVSMLAAMAIAAFVTSVPLMVWEIMSGGFVWPTAVGLLALAFAALGPAFLAQLTYMRGVELIGPGRAGVFINLVPIFGAIMAVVILGEPFARYHVLALLLVVGGIADRAKRRSRRATLAPPNPRRSTWPGLN